MLLEDQRVGSGSTRLATRGGHEALGVDGVDHPVRDPVGAGGALHPGPAAPVDVGPQRDRPLPDLGDDRRVDEHTGGQGVVQGAASRPITVA